MTSDGILRRLRGTVGTALVWGGAWVAVGAVVMAVFAVLSVVGIAPGGLSWEDALFTAVRMGIVGAVAGVAFSGLIRVLYQGRRLSELSWVRFGMGGALLTGVFVPLFLQTMNLISGDGLVAWELVLDDGLWTAAFGGIAAGGSLKVAQVADAALIGGARDDLDPLEGVDTPALESEGHPR